MATKLENLPLEIAHFNNIKSYVPGFTNLCEHTIDTVLKMGTLQVSTVFEHAVASAGGHDLVSKDEGDLYRATDPQPYSDAKLSTVRTYSYGRYYGAPVHNLYNKTGALRVQVYERKQDKFYYFVIPHHAYQHIGKSSNIEIPFFLDGTPRRNPTRVVYQNWWNYEVPDFTTMAVK
jgi:hypothetical protein